MTALRVEGVGKSFGPRTLFEDVTVSVDRAQCVGVVGANGSGKTTLLRIIAGLEHADKGQVIVEQDLRTGYLPQSERHDGSLWSFLRSRASHADREMLAAVSRFGLNKDDLDRPFSEYSGGERTRAGLAAIALESPDLILLDEPTNHLDIDGIRWLESFLRGQRESERIIVVVSHDRELLDAVCTRILEIKDARGRIYSGNYSSYAEQTARERAHQDTLYEAATRKIGQLRDALKERIHQAHSIDSGPKRGRDFYSGKSARVAKSAKAIEQRIERITAERPDKPKKTPNIRLTVGTADGRNRRVLWMHGVSKRFETRTLFHDVRLDLERGERVALVGPNGCGKSTLLKLMMGLESADSGEVRVSAGLSWAYMEQGRDSLNEKRRVLDELREVEQDETMVRTLLACLQLPGDRAYEEIGNLSLGERTRVAIAKLVLDRNDLLFLDEPTNHLDILSRDAIESALRLFEGSIVFATHDRRFLTLADRLLVFNGAAVQLLTGGYAEYVRGKEVQSQDGAQSHKLGDDDRLLLEMRLAELGRMLGDPKVGEREKHSLEQEYLETARRLRSDR